jgi:spoIIIJ-associated protein
VEWVEITGQTVGEATEAALEQLGVAAADAEVVVLSEPKVGLFGRTRGEARVRARVRPSSPRPKRPSRQRDRGRREGAGRSQNGARQGPPRDRTASTNGRDGRRQSAGGDTQRSHEGEAAEPGAEPRRSRNRNRSRSSGGAGASGEEGTSRPDAPSAKRVRVPAKEEDDMAEGMTLEEQAEVAKGFMEGLIQEFGFQAEVEIRIVDEDTVEIAANGDELGLLVGPRGSTLAALQDVTRTVVQHHFPSRTDRILVDVAGYRQRRIAALQRFSQEIATETLSTGTERALEPMSAADRKVVHDTVNEIDGVVTRSEGEDPARYVVIAASRD